MATRFVGSNAKQRLYAVIAPGSCSFSARVNPKIKNKLTLHRILAYKQLYYFYQELPKLSHVQDLFLELPQTAKWHLEDHLLIFFGDLYCKDPRCLGTDSLPQMCTKNQ